MAKLIAAYTDEELVQGCLRNDSLMQERFYKKYYGKMLSLCLRYCRNMEDAQELLNIGFLKVFNGLKSYQFKGSLEGWVRRVVLNSILEEHRRNVNYKSMMSFPEYEEDGQVEAESLENLFAEDIISLLNQVPTASRVVFNLFVIEGYSHKEIGKMLNISEGTSKWHVSVAKEKLKKLILQQSNVTEASYAI